MHVRKHEQVYNVLDFPWKENNHVQTNLDIKQNFEEPTFYFQKTNGTT